MNRLKMNKNMCNRKSKFHNDTVRQLKDR